MFSDFLHFLKHNVSIVRFGKRILLLIEQKGGFQYEFDENKTTKQKILLIAAQVFLINSAAKAFVVDMTSSNKTKILFLSAPTKVFLSNANPQGLHCNLCLESFFPSQEINTWKSQMKAKGFAKKSLETNSPDLNILLQGEKILDTAFYWCEINFITLNAMKKHH
jgi:hypothetical protein